MLVWIQIWADEGNSHRLVMATKTFVKLIEVTVGMTITILVKYLCHSKKKKGGVQDRRRPPNNQKCSITCRIIHRPLI